MECTLLYTEDVLSFPLKTLPNSSICEGSIWMVSPDQQHWSDDGIWFVNVPLTLHTTSVVWEFGSEKHNYSGKYGFWKHLQYWHEFSVNLTHCVPTGRGTGGQPKQSLKGQSWMGWTELLKNNVFELLRELMKLPSWVIKHSRNPPEPLLIHNRSLHFGAAVSAQTWPSVAETYQCIP